MRKVPPKVRQEVKSTVYRKADEHGYSNRDRVENSHFMNNLANDPEVGGKLVEHMLKTDVRRYIKDTILNRYAKDKTAEELSLESVRVIREVLDQGSVEIELKKSKRLSLHRLDDGDFVLLAGGTFLKWETALRKTLEYVASAPGLPPKNGRLHLVLNLATNNKPLTSGDRNHLSDALAYIDIKVFFASERV